MNKNEAILAKLVELGEVENYRRDIYCGDDYICSRRNFNQLERRENSIIFDALISECGKRGSVIVIENNYLRIKPSRGSHKMLFFGEISRESVAEAFCNVTGITEVSDD